MGTIKINANNVGRIAERIVANELEARGFRVSDLNSDGTAANADLLAVKPGHSVQIQVKGAVNENRNWWFQYGYCTTELIRDRQGKMFNRRQSFYQSDVVILVAIHSPSEYCCIILPIEQAERAADLNLERDYRTLTHAGAEKKPNKVWVSLCQSPRARADQGKFAEEREILQAHRDEKGWERLSLASRTIDGSEGGKRRNG